MDEQHGTIGKIKTMWQRIAQGWKSLTLVHVAIIVVFCLVVAASFALGALVGQVRPVMPLAPVEGNIDQPVPSDVMQQRPPRGTFGSIEEIRGDVIRLRDPRSGRTWSVRARRDTVIEAGPRRRIPFEKLQVGQRIFVVGMPNAGETPNEFDAQFIGVVLGQPQKFVRPAQEPAGCWECSY